MSSAVYDVHIVSHTHWDREWYQPLGRFKQRLVELIDELLDDPPRPGESFLLDGQGVVLEDYLAVRPDRASELSKLLRDGRLEAGPWYVLADELIPGGESLVRNLLAGFRVLRSLRGSPPAVLYCPDSFGHPATLPELAAGFGFGTVILWRGLGGARWPSGDTFRWTAPSGTTALVFHLPSGGYDIGSNLPTSEPAASARWRQLREILAPRSRLGVLLVHNGGDHHARQARRDEAVDALIAAARPDAARTSSIAGFVRDLESKAGGADLPEITGELRDSYGYSWTLQGTFGTRAYQKRKNAHAERMLVRESEPWSAMARRRGGKSRRALVQAAWKTLLQCHPHDTLCGCSLDAVAQAMDERLDDALVQGTGIRDDALLDVVGHDRVAARDARSAWREVVIARNSVPRPRGGVATLLLKSFLADEPVGHPSAGASVTIPDHQPPSLSGIAVQLLSSWVDRDRIESPRHYPDNDFVSTALVAAWLPPIGGYGTLAIAHGQPDDGLPPSRVSGGDTWIDNGTLRLDVSTSGVRLTDGSTGRVLSDVIGFEDLRDVGDLYTPAPRGPAADVKLVSFETLHRGPLRGEIETRWTITRPGENLPDVAEATVRLILDAGSSVVRIEVEGAAFALDHRTRFVLRTAVRDATVYADATFGPVRRAQLRLSPEDARAELPPPTDPLHRYVSLFGQTAGATIFSDGLAEYEVGDTGEVAVTLVRAVGALSKIDLPERPGHAGWPEETPWAQWGMFEGVFGLLVHSSTRDAETIDTIERVADDVLLPLTGTTLRSALALPPPTESIELVGQGVAFSAVKDSENGDWLVLRAVNLTDEPRHASWRLGFPLSEACLSRLDETPGDALPIEGRTVHFHASPRGIMTILVR